MADRADVWMLIDQLVSLEGQLVAARSERDAIKDKLRKIVADAFPVTAKNDVASG